jgi:hypothetical protein
VVTAPELSRRQLGRTLLVRQHLVEPTDATVEAMTSHLVGLQAQQPRDPYLGLWSRLTTFEPADLEALLLGRSVVRIALMRSTIHLVTAADALGLRPLMAPVLEKELERHSEHAPRLRDVDLAPVLRHARAFLREPRSTTALRAELAARFPDHDPGALAYACRNHLALVQVPPRGLWQRSGQVTYATAEAWLDGRDAPPGLSIEEPGQSIEEPGLSIEEPGLSIEEVVARYLRAFGPASTADVAAWTRLTGLREVLERLRPELRTYRDEGGRELFDVADGTIAPEDLEVPVRFLPEYDNVLLSHADRARVIDRALLPGLYADGRVGNGSVLVDGLVQASWRYDRGRDPAVVVTHQARLGRAARDAVEAEAHRAAAYLVPGEAEATVALRPAENAGGPE